MFKIGQKVTFVSLVLEQGIVKDINEKGNPFVVYNCNNDWENYRNYTGCLTEKSDLIPEWVDKENIKTRINPLIKVCSCNASVEYIPQSIRICSKCGAIK